jgi:hypothetical protein
MNADNHKPLFTRMGNSVQRADMVIAIWMSMRAFAYCIYARRKDLMYVCRQKGIEQGNTLIIDSDVAQ